MNNQEQLEDLLESWDFEDLLKKSDEILNLNKDVIFALKCKAESLYYLKEYENALGATNSALYFYPEDNGLLKIKFECLLNLEKFDELFGYFMNFESDIGLGNHLIQILAKKLRDAGQPEKALKCCEKALELRPSELEIIDVMKSIVNEFNLKLPSKFEKYYISWIYKIKKLHRRLTCPFCGERLIPIVYGYPSEELMRKEDMGEVVLGGCCIDISNPELYCKNCHVDFVRPSCKIKIESEDINEFRYIIKSLNSMDYFLNMGISKDVLLEDDIGEFDKKEMNAFINHLLEIGYLKLDDGLLKYDL